MRGKEGVEAVVGSFLPSSGCKRGLDSEDRRGELKIFSWPSVNNLKCKLSNEWKDILDRKQSI